MQPKFPQLYFGATPLNATQRAGIQVTQAQRNARWHVKLSATVTTVDGTGAVTAVAGGATLRNAISLAITNNGEDLFQMQSAAFYGHMAEFDAQQPLAGTRLAAGVVAAGARTLTESFPIDFSRYRQGISRETAFIESAPSSNLFLYGIIDANAIAKMFTFTGTASATITNCTMEVAQDAGEAIGSRLPIFRPELQAATFPLAANSANVKFQLNLPSYDGIRISDMLIACIGADGRPIQDATGILSLTMRGSQSQQIIGPTPTPFLNLLDMQREIASGDLSVVPGILQLCYQPAGALSDTLNAANYNNLSLYANGGTVGGQVLVISRVLNRPTPLNGAGGVPWQTVLPADQVEKEYPWVFA